MNLRARVSVLTGIMVQSLALGWLVPSTTSAAPPPLRVSLSVVSPACGTVAITSGVEAPASPEPQRVELRLYVDGRGVAVCRATRCVWAWDTTKVRDGLHVLRARAHAGTRGLRNVQRGGIVVRAVVANAASRDCVAYRMGSDTYDVPQFPRPERGQPFRDPVFGGTVVRITDRDMIPDDAAAPALGMTLEYSRYPGVNADRTKAVLGVLGGVDRGAWYVIDLLTGTRLATIRVGGDPELSWHPTDPNRALFRDDNGIYVFRADTLTAEPLFAFEDYGYVSTKQEGRPSDDWRYLALLARRRHPDGTCCDWDRADILVADLLARRVVAAWTPPSVPDWVGMSPGGDYVVVMFTDGSGTRLYRRDGTFVRTLIPDVAHGDFAIDARGQEVLVYLAQTSAQIAELGGQVGIASVRLRDGTRRVVLPTGWWWAAHVSGIASRTRPGWVLVSTYTAPGSTQMPFGREVFWLALDRSGVTKRIAHHHSDRGERLADGYVEGDYFASPKATSSWDGNTVVFTSTWGDAFRQYDVYALTGCWWP